MHSPWSPWSWAWISSSSEDSYGLWERLAANVGVVLLFGAFHFRFIAHR
jgi:hypothetical protein